MAVINQLVYGGEVIRDLIHKLWNRVARNSSLAVSINIALVQTSKL